MPLRNFLESKGEKVGQKISGAKSKGFGSLADLYVPMEDLQKALEAVKNVSYEAYIIDLFMFKTGTRIEATLEALIEDFREDENTVKVVDKGRHSTGRKTWKKYIDEDLKAQLKSLIKDRRTGKIFSLTSDEMCDINKIAYQKTIPEILAKIPMVNHFWRHMFAQHMLRRTDWNYAVVASLGGWTIQALQESYGKPPEAIVAQWGLKYYPTLKVTA
jgi:integrase